MAPTKRTNKRTVKKSPPNHVSVTERASRLFAFYLMMGSSSSLNRLHEMLTKNGLSKVTLSTLKAYSRDYHWQELIAEAQTALPDPVEEYQIAIQDMNMRHAELGKALTGLAEISVPQLRSIIHDGQAMRATDITTLAKEGASLERLARGEATSRTEVLVQSLSVVVNGVVALFQQVNDLPSSQERLERFMLGADTLVRQAVPADYIDVGTNN